MGGSPFVGKPLATSWGLGRMDLWAIGADQTLYHTWWDGPSYGGWESLGGSFATAPSVVSWNTGRFDIVGLNASNDDGEYLYKCNKSYVSLSSGPY